MKEVIDEKATADRKAVKDLREKIEEKTKEQTTLSPLKERTERFNDFVKTAHPALKQHLEKTTKKGKLELNIDAMAPVKNLVFPSKTRLQP